MKGLFLKAAVLIALLASCRAAGPRSVFLKTSENYCEPALSYSYDATFLPQPDVQAILQRDTALVRSYSRHDVLMANAAGVLPLLRELVVLEKDIRPDAQQQRLAKRQQVLERLLLASTEIASLAAELDCEGERADQLATYLDNYDQRRIRRLTLISIVTGAATTVATALIQTDGLTKMVGIGGGLISAGFGGVAAFSSNQTVQFLHQRNLLTDIWKEPKTSAVYSPLVWYVLNEKLFSNTGEQSIGYNIRQRWRGYVLNQASTEEENRYFGPGGTYGADALHARANMLNQLQSSVRSINQDLQSLLMSVSR